MTNTTERFTSIDVLNIFKEQHRLCARLVMGDDTVDITADLTIRDWRVSMDLLRWPKLSEYLNEGWKIQIDPKEWGAVFEHEKTKPLIELCSLIAQYAKKPSFAPVKRMGTECLTAGVFLSIKWNLKSRGVNVSELKPSSQIKPYLTEYLSEMIEEITQTGKPIIDDLILTKRKKEKSTFLQKLNIFDRYHHEIELDSIQTFRELVEKLVHDES